MREYNILYKLFFNRKGAKNAKGINNQLLIPYSLRSLRLCGYLFLLTSCGEELMQQEIHTTTPIVESYLVEGTTNLSVKLYSMEVYLGEEYILSQPIAGLSLKINDKELTEIGTGIYSLALEEDTIRAGQEYNLQFEYNGKAVKASTFIPQPVTGLKIEPESITRTSFSYYWGMDSDTTQIFLSWDNPDNGFYQVYIDASNASSSGFDTNFRKRVMQPIQASSYTTSLREFRTAGIYFIYVYKVNKEYVELYERVSSTDLANPVSFIDNALGIFTSMSVAGVRFTVYESEE
ncbi:MAG: hypothetical protein EZS26_001385 [Candidatus Ordinivivax streblomastigis]|uniref:DUF4249 family protein n=1 Tax=Candidatus Ordinivivax streblomastigis TaxID=2540710 RepID=A0A5M8P281_9BACT|nr:MAG: hypothetical protein EZS26_001385 [Candidatus Ordinivivax streblomastigis]